MAEDISCRINADLKASLLHHSDDVFARGHVRLGVAEPSDAAVRIASVLAKPYQGGLQTLRIDVVLARCALPPHSGCERHGNEEAEKHETTIAIAHYGSLLQSARIVSALDGKFELGGVRKSEIIRRDCMARFWFVLRTRVRRQK